MLASRHSPLRSPCDPCSAATLVDEQGNLTNASTREFLAKFMQAFADWIARVGK